MSPDDSDRFSFWFSVIWFTLFSALGSGFIIVSVMMKWRRDFSARFVMYLSIADFCLSVVCLSICAYNLHFGHVQSASIACLIQPVVTWYFMLASILWLAAISVNSCYLVFTSEPLSFRKEVLVNIICWGLPLVTIFIPLSPTSGEAYGPRNDLWCSYAVYDKGQQLANLLVYYLPALVIIAVNYSIILYRIKFLGHKDISDTTRQEMVKAIKKLFSFVLAYFIVWTPLVICYIYERSSGQFVPFWAEFISDNLMHIQGIINFILYGLNERLHQNLKSMYMQWRYGLSSRSSSKRSHSESKQEGVTLSIHLDSMGGV